MRTFLTAICSFCILLVLSACDGKKETPTVVVDDDKPMVDEGPFPACQVTDTGGIDDKSFNATAWKGMTDAAAALDNVEVIYLESEQQQDYEANIQAFIEEEIANFITIHLLSIRCFAKIKLAVDRIRLALSFGNSDNQNVAG